MQQNPDMELVTIFTRTVIRSGTSENGSEQRIEFSLTLKSNSEFTASVLVAYTRAVGKMTKEGQIGARTVFDIPLGT